MVEPIIMPKTGMAMEEGIILEWLVKEGDTVAAGDPIVEIETDKSTMEVESDRDGTILRILYEDGTTVPVVEPIAWIGDPGETIPESRAAVQTGVKNQVPSSSTFTVSTVPAPAEISIGKVKATPAARRAASERDITLDQIRPAGRYGEIKEADVLALNRTRATPLARRVAQSEEIDLTEVKGSGFAGKIFTADFAVNEESGTDKRIPLTKIQKITGKRMFQSHTEIPVVSMDIQADVTELLRIRKQLNDTLDGKITINDFVLKATALALEENPRMNSVLDGENLICKSAINLNIAVATDKGLLVPVVRNANTMTLRQLSREAAEIARKGRDGKLTQEDMEGGTFTVSNIGMYGITSFTPIINQPQAAILGVCAVDEKLKLVDGQVCVNKVMGLSITFDHRIVDGAEASVFFSRIRELLESPLAILA
ncbi:MAG: 2-oxo acid dehydrogenase subunit E2 [Spirochaetaceae bacterium]|nr:2-oxo acid dehydrogenase subunit E2 [Spirochaetaceae bacterium]